MQHLKRHSSLKMMEFGMNQQSIILSFLFKSDSKKKNGMTAVQSSDRYSSLKSEHTYQKHYFVHYISKMNTKVGGVKQGTELDGPAQQILAYIRTIDPTISKAQMIRLDKQVVAGLNYFFHFDVGGKDTVVKVWSRPWLGNFLQVTKSNGEKVVSGGS